MTDKPNDIDRAPTRPLPGRLSAKVVAVVG